MTQLEEIPVITPLGPAMCFGVNSNCANPVWACWIDATGEMWWFGNPFVRRRPTVTGGQPRVSGFRFVNACLWRHIDRYIAAGWLAPGYDPERPETWK